MSSTKTPPGAADPTTEPSLTYAITWAQRYVDNDGGPRRRELGMLLDDRERAWRIAGGGRCTACGEVVTLTADGALTPHVRDYEGRYGSDDEADLCDGSGSRDHEPPTLSVRVEHDEGGVTGAAVPLVAHLREHYADAPDRELDDLTAELSRQILLRAGRQPDSPDDPAEIQARIDEPPLSRDDLVDRLTAAAEDACQVAAIEVEIHELDPGPGGWQRTGRTSPLRRLVRALDGAGLMDTDAARQRDGGAADA